MVLTEDAWNMVLKIQSLVMVSLLLMQFLGIVYGQEIPGVYIPDTVNRENPNLLIGGIRQNSPDPNKNTEKEMAEQFGAIYVPTYYSGPAKDQADELIKIAGDALEVNKAASCAKSHEATYLNGLSSDALKGPKTYNTIVAYSGGTVSAVTALDKQNVRCHTLILISPMIGMVPATTAWFYEQQVKRLLENGAVQRIVVIQSSDDQPPGDILYQAEFKKDEISGIDVYDVDLKTTGIEAHKEMFYEYAKNHLKLNKNNGRVYYMPNGADSGVVGKWDSQEESETKCTIFGKTECTLSRSHSIIEFHKDGTFTDTALEVYYQNQEDVWVLAKDAELNVVTGKWIQYGNAISLHFQYDPKMDEPMTIQDEGDPWEGTINENIMSGTGSGLLHMYDPTADNGNPLSYDCSYSTHWTASKIESDGD